METDSTIACNIVKTIFKHINLCLQNDRSRQKVNMFEKGVIKGMLGDRTLNGINNYIFNMYPLDVKNLMNDLEEEIKKRQRT